MTTAFSSSSVPLPGKHVDGSSTTPLSVEDLVKIELKREKDKRTRRKEERRRKRKERTFATGSRSKCAELASVVFQPQQDGTLTASYLLSSTPTLPQINYVPFYALLLTSALLSFAAVCILLWRSSSNASMQLIITMGSATCINCFAFCLTGLFHGFNLERKIEAAWFSWLQGALITFTECIIFLMGCAISHLIYERGVLLKGYNKFLKGDDSKKRVKVMIAGAFAIAFLFTGVEAVVLYCNGNAPAGLFSIRPKPPWAKSVAATLYAVATIFVLYRSCNSFFLLLLSKWGD